MEDPGDQDLPTEHVEGQTVLVTGGAGFIGRHLVEAAAPVADVRVLDHDHSKATLPPGVTTLEGDVRDEDVVAAAMHGVDTVFHQAAMVSVPESVADPATCTAVNVDGTVTVLEAARKEDARAVVASSAAVYGPPDEVPISERHPTEPTTPYGVSKLAADLYTRRYEQLYGLPTVALRYFNVYGPYQSSAGGSVVPTFVEQARAGGPITVHGDGEQTRDFVHVEDVVRANLLAAGTDATGVAYNVGTGDAISIRELAARVRSLAPRDPDIVHEEGRPADVTHSRPDVTRAVRDLGYEPTVSLDDGLARLVQR